MRYSSRFKESGKSRRFSFYAKSAILLAALVSGNFAYADIISGRVVYEDAEIPDINVRSNGVEYTDLASAGTLNWRVRIVMGTDGLLNPKIKSWKIWPRIQTGYKPQDGIYEFDADLKDYYAAESYVVRKKYIETYASNNAPAHLMKKLGVDACNKLADHHRSNAPKNC